MPMSIPNLPAGPLDPYRERSKFDWKKLKIFFEEKPLWEVKVRVWEALKTEPLFQKSTRELTIDDQRRLANLRLRRIQSLFLLPAEKAKQMTVKDRAKYFLTVDQALSSIYPEVALKLALGVSLFQNAIGTLGTERHQPIIDALFNKQILGAVCLTEIAHGSDARNMRTSASYDKHAQEFVINTPDFKAAKCWSGNLGKSCTAILLFAQLIIDNQSYGLNAFIVPVRDPKTLLPYPNLEIGDLGEKTGLNGLDNGYIIFKNYRIPREYLLNRFADVTPNGEYESSFAEPGQMLGAALENLSAARIGIVQENSYHLIIAITIAVRYAAVRKQFGPTNTELPIIEHQLHQWRLFPYVAKAAVFKIFSITLTNNYLNAVNKSQNSQVNLETLKDEIAEVHAMISSAKPIVTWTCRDAIQECREACGGHGYLKASRFSMLKETNDPCCTYEGDNNILIQQTSNWLLRQWGQVLKGELPSSPLRSSSFLINYSTILNQSFNGTCTGDVQTYDFIVKSYQWLITYMVKITNERKEQLLNEYKCTFTARNGSQVYKAAILSRIYLEYVAFVQYWDKVHNPPVDSNLIAICEQLGILFGLVCLEKHLVLFYQGEYAKKPHLITFIKEGIVENCARLKNDVISVIDALAPPDYVINSVLGNSDGKVYEHLEESIRSNSSERPNWWKEITFDNAPDLRAKL